MSHERTISQPPAVARPSTAAMMGFDRSRVTMPPKPPLAVMLLPSGEPIDLRSWPEQNVGLSPTVTARRTPTHVSLSDSRRSMAASISCATWRLTALRASGRLSVMRATRPSTS